MKQKEQEACLEGVAASMGVEMAAYLAALLEYDPKADFECMYNEALDHAYGDQLDGLSTVKYLKFGTYDLAILLEPRK